MKTLLLLIAFLTIPLLGFSQAPNDECVDRETITIGVGSYLQYTTDTSTATESLDSSCNNAALDNLDVWYEFVMPVTGNLRVTNIPSTVNIVVYDSCGGAEIKCFFNDNFVYSLTSGTTYVMRLSEEDFWSGTVNFRVEAFAQALNDVCADRETIAIGVGSYNEYPTDFRAATESLDSSCNNAALDNLDVWYEFVMPVTGNLRVTNIPNTVNVVVYDSCGGAEIKCFFNDGFVYSLTSGTTYVMRLSEDAFWSGSDNFRVEAFAQAPNDECADRETIIVGVGSYNEYPTDFRAATESLDSSCNNASLDNLDVWYEFVMPVTGNLKVTNIPNTVNVVVYDSCGGAEIRCFFNDGFVYSLTSGTTYVMRLSEEAFWSGSDNFRVEAFEQAPNDECADRETITIGVGSYNEYPTDFRAATESLDSSCNNASLDNLDVWYEFVMPVTGNLKVTNIPNTVNVVVYDSCGGAEIRCFFNDGFVYSLTSGTTYVMRLSEEAFWSGSDNFRVEAFAQAPNDECADRETITIGVGSYNEYPTDLRTATESLDSSCNNASLTNLDVWYEFMMPVTGNLKITNIANTVNVVVYDSCGGAEVNCFFNDGYVYSLSSGTTYVMRLSQEAFWANSSSFRVEAFEQATNDECINSQPIAVGVVSPINYAVDTRTATESIDATCDNASLVNHDMWYKFEMPMDGNIQITGVPSFAGSSLFDSCGGTEISCFYNDGTFFGLSANTSYVLRISEEAFWSASFSFNIQAVAAVLPPCTDTTEFIGGAWDNGVPDNTKNAIIRSNYTTSDVGLGSITACSCSVDLATTLTIDSGDYLDVSFGITVDGTLNVNHQGSVVQRDDLSTTTNNGNINVHMTTPFMKPKDFMITGSPMTAETRNGVYNSAFRMLHHITGNFVPHPDVEIDFPDAENFADDNNNNWALHNGLINPAEGYAVKPQLNNSDGNTTYDFTFSQGTLNTGDVTYNVLFNTTKNDSPNMMANPYPSAIFAGDFINQNSMIDEVFFWEHLTAPSTSFPGANSKNYDMEDISMYNLTGGVKAANDATGITKPDGFIATSQGFGIKANAAGTAMFTNIMRRTSHNTTLRDAEENMNRIWLNVSSDDYEMTGSTLIGFTENASSSMDAGYDSKRLATLLSLYSHLEDGSQELGIQARESFNEDIQIPMGFSTQIEEVAQYTISISEIEGDNLTLATVFLVDNQEHIVANLSDGDYQFMSNQGTFNNRFTLQFSEEGILSTPENELQSIYIYPNPASDFISINNTQQLALESVVIKDLTGRVVKNSSLKGMGVEKTIDISKLANATYLMTIKTQNNQITKRIIKK